MVDTVMFMETLDDTIANAAVPAMAASLLCKLSASDGRGQLNPEPAERISVSGPMGDCPACVAFPCIPILRTGIHGLPLVSWALRADANS